MIDKITLIKNNLSNPEKLQIIERNNLQSFYNESSNIKIFDNAKTKNLTGGILIKITGEKLKIEGSIHKYFHFLQFKTLENYTVFTMQDFLNTIETLFNNFQIPGRDFFVINYEIGLNVYLETGEPIDYLKKIKSIGNLDGTQRKIYINPRYKKERLLCTQMHKDNTVVFRVYDKNFERLDKGRKDTILQCIRIETLRTRQKKLTLLEFCKPEQLLLMQNKFFAEWNKLNFDKEIQAPPGTHQTKKDLAKKILLEGANVTVQELEERRKQLTVRIFRNSKEFIKGWETHKFNFSLVSCEIMTFWAHSYNVAIQAVTDYRFKN